MYFEGLNLILRPNWFNDSLYDQNDRVTLSGIQIPSVTSNHKQFVSEFSPALISWSGVRGQKGKGSGKALSDMTLEWHLVVSCIHFTLLHGLSEHRFLSH